MEQTFIRRVIRDATIFALSVITLFSLAVFLADTSSAQTAEVTTEQPTAEPVVVEEPREELDVQFIYIAEPCDNLTKLVRKSILIYDENNEQVQLSEADIVYVETNVVQKMGAFMLDIGDEVVIEGDMIAKYAAESQGLTEEQTAAWSVYVPTVDYELTNIQQPENVDEVIEELNGEMDTGNSGDSDDNGDDESVSALWWVAGIGAAVVVWYLLWRREEDDQ